MKSNCSLIEYALKFSGMSVDSANSASQGFAKAVEKQYDILIVDRNMPEISGKEFVLNLTKRQEYSQIPIILISGDAESKIIADAEIIDAKAWYRKPVDLVDMTKKIQDICNKNV